jgi:YidC/Oxa1 family membrane protein insertase
MTDFLPTFALLLQSNEAVARAIEGGGTLQPDLATYTGFTGVFAVMFLKLIQMWGSFTGNYGLAIILTAISVRLALLPLTRMQIRGMKMMQVLQPVQKEITRYYPNKLDQNAKLMELYKEYKINPLAGCLPMLIQLPIMIAVYRALYDPSFVGHHFLNIQLLFPVSLTSARSMGHGPDMPDMLDITVAQLGLQNQIWHIPPGLPLIGGSFWYLPAVVLVVLYAGSSVLMQRVMKKVNSPDPEFAEAFKEEMKSKDTAPEQPDFAAQMQKNMGIMNVMILLLAFIFSAGALIYFVVQNLLMCLEYTFLSKGGGPPANATELKAFIRRPPPPLPQNAVAVDNRARATAGSGASRGGGRSNGATKSEGRVQPGAEAYAAGMSPGPADRPRKKRRKR